MNILSNVSGLLLTVTYWWERKDNRPRKKKKTVNTLDKVFRGVDVTEEEEGGFMLDSKDVIISLILPMRK